MNDEENNALAWFYRESTQRLIRDVSRCVNRALTSRELLDAVEITYSCNDHDILKNVVVI